MNIALHLRLPYRFSLIWSFSAHIFIHKFIFSYAYVTHTIFIYFFISDRSISASFLPSFLLLSFSFLINIIPTNHPSFLSSPLLSTQHLILSVFCWRRLCAVGSIVRSWGDRISSSKSSNSNSSNSSRSGFIGALRNKINATEQK